MRKLSLRLPVSRMQMAHFEKPVVSYGETDGFHKVGNRKPKNRENKLPGRACIAEM